MLFCSLRSKLFREQFWGSEKGRNRSKIGHLRVPRMHFGVTLAFFSPFRGGKRNLSFVAQHVRVETFLGFDFAKNARYGRNFLGFDFGVLKMAGTGRKSAICGFSGCIFGYFLPKKCIFHAKG